MLPKFQPLSINLPSSLVTMLLLMTPLFWNALPDEICAPYPLSEISSKPTCSPRYTYLSLTHPMAFSVVLGPLFSVPGYGNWLTVVVLLYLGVPFE